MQHQIGGAQGVLSVATTADPDKFFEADSVSGGGWGIEGIAGVDEHAMLAADGRGGEQRIEQAGAAGRGGTGDFGDTPARKINTCDTGREAIGVGWMTPAEWKRESCNFLH